MSMKATTLNDKFQVKLIPSTEKVLPYNEPNSDGFPDKLIALRGEEITFQIAFKSGFPLSYWGHIDLTSNGLDMTAREVRLVPCAFPCNPETDEDYLSTIPGMYPDLLRDISHPGYNIPANQWRSLWITVNIPIESLPGNYNFSITLRTESYNGWEERYELAEITGSIEILNTVLPSLDIPHTEWFHYDCLANYYNVEVFSEEHWRIIGNFIKSFVKMGATMLLLPVFTPPLDTAPVTERTTVQLVDVTVTDNSYTFGFDKLKHLVHMASDLGVKYFEISHLFTQWGSHNAPKIEACCNGEIVQIFGRHTDSASEEYGNFLRCFLNALIPTLKELGVFENCYFHIADEPTEKNLPSYLSAKKHIENILADCNSIDATSDIQMYKSGAIKEPVVSINHMEPFLADRPEKLWAYYCTGQCVDTPNRFIVMPGYRQRVLGTLLYKYRIDGFLHWGFNFYNSALSMKTIDPYQCTDADAFFPSGDSFLVYPGKGGIPEESIRYVLMYECMADYRLLKLAESIVGRKAVMQMIDSLTDKPFTFTSYPRSSKFISNIRFHAIELIRKGPRK